MKLYSSIRNYPFKQRLPYAALMIGFIAWSLRNSWPGDPASYILAGVLVFTLFFSTKGRPFWFFWGILAGAFFMAYSNAHSWMLRH